MTTQNDQVLEKLNELVDLIKTTLVNPKVEKPTKKRTYRKRNKKQPRVLKKETDEPEPLLESNKPQTPIKHKKNRITNPPKKHPTKGMMARIESINTSQPRPNLFLNMADKNSHREDTKIDKKLIGTNQPTTRRPAIEFVEVECDECGYTYEVSPSLLIRNMDTGEFTYKCNDCQISHRK